MSPKLEKRLLLHKSFFLITSVEGFITLIVLFSIPSEIKSAWMFGFSRSRLAIGMAVLLATFVIGFLAIRSWLDSQWAIRLDDRVTTWLERDDHLLSITTHLGFCLLLLAGIIVLFLPQVESSMSSYSWVWEDVYNKFSPIYERLEALILWGVALAVQCLVTMIMLFHPTYKQTGFWKSCVFYQALLPNTILVVTFCHWLILYFHLYVFIAIPNWFWKFYEKPTRHNYVLIILVLASLLVAASILNSPKRRWNLLLVIALGYSLIVGFAYAENNGFVTLQQHYFEKGRRGYIEFACTQPSILDTMRNFEEIARENSSFFNTKPPGTFGFHLLVNKISASRERSVSVAECGDNQIRFMSYTYPLMAFLTLVPLYFLSRSLLGADKAIFPVLLYVFIPNIILTPLFLDQALFPLLFIIGIFFSYQMIQRNSITWALITGAWSFIATYFSFSLLPLIFMSAAWLTMDYLLNKDKRKLSQFITSTIGLIIGFLAAWGLSWLLLNYDFVLRYNTALSAHREHKEFYEGIQQIKAAALVNNVEFIAWIGFPVAILFLSSLIRTLHRWYKKRITYRETALLAFMLMFIALNLFGQTKSEVARLWLFLVPMVSLFASDEIYHAFKNPTRGYLLVIFMQLVTMILTFKLQDLD